jgi:hypothetical protein
MPPGDARRAFLVDYGLSQPWHPGAPFPGSRGGGTRAGASEILLQCPPPLAPRARATRGPLGPPLANPGAARAPSAGGPPEGAAAPAFYGTPLYASRASLRGGAPSPADDAESLLYTLLSLGAPLGPDGRRLPDWLPFTARGGARATSGRVRRARAGPLWCLTGGAGGPRPDGATGCRRRTDQAYCHCIQTASLAAAAPLARW